MKLDFYVQMHCETGVPEFFLDEFAENNPHSNVQIRKILQEMLRQLRFYEALDDCEERDLDINDEGELVVWDFDAEADDYTTKFVERVTQTIGEIEYQLDVLADLEAKQQEKKMQN